MQFSAQNKATSVALVQEWNDRITEWWGLEATSRDHLVNPLTANADMP